nr:peptidoglycan DD-metalloendopeptidase family protein [Alginatibacterium sediminis]
MSKYRRRLLAVLCASLLALLFFFPMQQSSEAIASSDKTSNPPSADHKDIIGESLSDELLIGQRYPLSLNIQSIPLSEKQLNSDNTQQWTKHSLEVKSGDSLALLFKRAGLSAKQLYAIDQLGGEAQQLRRLRPGNIVDIWVDVDNLLQKIEFKLSREKTLRIARDSANNFSVAIDALDVEIRHDFAHGEISSSFWNAGIESNLSQGQIMDLAGIFGWDVDFALDIRKGDQFTVWFEKRYSMGEAIGNGEIIAAEFINQGEVFQAVRHSDGDYYTPEGLSMRKAFLRAPVAFNYISSNFNPRRLHPVTGKVKAHNGIDYAARTGTPVQSSGDGKVIASAYSKFNGNYVFIQHSSQYVTKYLHLNKRKVKKGQRVKQGQIIGTVGATGRVTGPHLHYEFLVNGAHRNPRTVKLPENKPLAGDERDAFVVLAKQEMERLESSKRIMLAMRQ